MIAKVIVADSIEFFGRDSRGDCFAHFRKGVGSQCAGNPHQGNCVWGLHFRSVKWARPRLPYIFRAGDIDRNGVLWTQDSGAQWYTRAQAHDLSLLPVRLGL